MGTADETRIIAANCFRVSGGEASADYENDIILLHVALEFWEFWDSFHTIYVMPGCKPVSALYFCNLALYTSASQTVIIILNYWPISENA